MSGSLELEDVVAGYQPGIDILQGISLRAEPGRITLVIGPNGAGKSTLLKTIFGFLASRAGTVRYGGATIAALEPYAIKARGIGYIPQELNMFPNLTIEENLKMGAWTIRKDRKRVKERLGSMYETFAILAQRRHRRATELSGGQARMLSVARELMTEPSMILVDEPTAGLAPAIVDQVYELLQNARAMSGCGILLVDQNIDAAVRVADFVYLLNLGRVRNQGTPDAFAPERARALIAECLAG